MLIAFRTDANAEIGTGHLMRCLALADVLAAHGARCVFLCRSAGLDGLAARITAAGHVLIALPEMASSIEADIPNQNDETHLPTRWWVDAHTSLDALADFPSPDWLVVDHYALDARWHRELRSAVHKIMVIDDLADRDHDCDLLLDQNLANGMETRYSDRVPRGCSRLLGPSYALLRPEFAALREAALTRAQPVEIRRVLVMFGGADFHDLTSAGVKLLTNVGFAGRVDVVAGPLYGPVLALQGQLSASPGARLHVQPPNIAGLMARADLALGSPGVTSWERCVLGLPTIAIAVANNQESLAKALARAGGHCYLGRWDQVDIDRQMNDAFAKMRAREHRQWVHTQAMAICDGNGCERVVKRLMGST